MAVRGVLRFTVAAHVTDICITAQYIGDRQHSGLWQSAHVENCVLTQYPWTQTQLQLPRVDEYPQFPAYADAVRVLTSAHQCFCQGDQLADYEQRNYWPFCVSVVPLSDDKVKVCVFLANTIDSEGMVLTDFIGF